jgi:hypothetical protein
MPFGKMVVNRLALERQWTEQRIEPLKAAIVPGPEGSRWIALQRTECAAPHS